MYWGECLTCVLWSALIAFQCWASSHPREVEVKGQIDLAKGNSIISVEFLLALLVFVCIGHLL